MKVNNEKELDIAFKATFSQGFFATDPHGRILTRAQHLTTISRFGTPELKH